MYWTTELNKKLEEMFDADCTDAQISAVVGTSVMAVAKQRSNLGIVHYKRNNKLKRAKPVQASVPQDAYYVLSYTKDGLRHYSNLGSMPLQRAIKTAVVLIHANNIADVNVLKSCGIIKNGSLKYKQINVKPSA